MNQSTDKFTNVNFGDRLSLLIADSGVDQKTIAASSGVSEGALTNYKKGRLPGSEELLKLARYFETTTDFLLGWEGKSREISTATSVAEFFALKSGGSEEEQQKCFNEFTILLSETHRLGREFFARLTELEQRANSILKTERTNSSARNSSQEISPRSAQTIDKFRRKKSVD